MRVIETVLSRHVGVAHIFCGRAGRDKVEGNGAPCGYSVAVGGKRNVPFARAGDPHQAGNHVFTVPGA